MFKKSIKKIINILGFDIRRRNLGEKNLSFDEILKKNLGNEPMILDVGANRGQSIKRFFNLFSNPTIHSFEPIKSEFGYHLVFVESYSKGFQPTYEQVKNKVINDYLIKKKDEEVNKYLSDLKKDYEVIINPNLKF